MKGRNTMKTITKFIYIAFGAVVVMMGEIPANGAPPVTPTTRPTPTPRPRPTPGGQLLAASINGNRQNGGGFIYEYLRPGVQNTFAGLSEPRGVAFDHLGNLFVANNFFDDPSQTFQPTIVKITPDGVQSTFATLSGDFFLQALAFDLAGNLFVMAEDNTDPDLASTIYKFTPGGVQSTFGDVPGQGLGLAFDSGGNLFAADFFDQTIYKFTPDGTRSEFVGPSAFDPDTGPTGLAFDRFGNLFVSVAVGGAPVQNGDSILKFTPEGVGSPFATGLNYPRGLSFDRNNNLFVAEVNEFGPGDILKFTPDGMMIVFAVVPGGVNSGPEWLAFP